jgi:hypothetical protein
MSLASELKLAFDRAPAPSRKPTLARELFAFDRVSMRTFDADRRLHVENCAISKATVNPYYGREIPDAEALGLDPDKVYRLYRDPVELEKAAPTFARLQLLDLHTAVDADDPKLEYTAGTVGSDVRFENPYLRASLAIWKADSIARVLEKKTAQLSCSYRYRADMTPGVTPGGLAYDGVMRDIVGNHVALVKEGRAGPDVFVNDALPTGLNMYKFPNILAVVASVMTGLTDTQKTALDAAFEEKAKDGETDAESAMDSREEAMDAREEAMDAAEKDEVAKGDRAKARDGRKSARDKRAADRKAKDKAKDGNWGLGGKAGDTDPSLASQEEGLKGGKVKGNDGATVAAAIDTALKSGKLLTADDAQKRIDAAIAARDALTQAKTDVAPLVGPITVAMDSAEAVYRFALDQAKVAHKDVHPSALAALVSAEIRVRKGNTAPIYDATPAEYNVDAIFLSSAK